ncbi:MAG: hypothetical protein ACKO96_38595, partial [Flammeovirgaceae bacterium]
MKKVKATNNHKSLKEVGPNTNTIKDILKVIMIPLTRTTIQIPKIMAECKRPTHQIKIVLLVQKLVKNFKIKMIILV